jgi:2-amino-4-hydroxy-6-hydroxymethyldihydropteridine diphosphokinase
MANLAYLSLGSNIGDRAKNLREAISKLKGLGRVAAVSSFYETEPVEVTDQDWFVNCAVELETDLGSSELMSQILKIESDLGRRRAVKKGPRIIDIDILLFGNEVQSVPELVIPHPAMTQRRFVLEPLAEIAPEAMHPVMAKTVQELLNELPSGQVVRKL